MSVGKNLKTKKMIKHKCSIEARHIAPNGGDFSRFNGLNPLIKEVPKGIPTDKIPTNKRKPEGISFIGWVFAKADCRYFQFSTNVHSRFCKYRVISSCG